MTVTELEISQDNLLRVLAQADGPNIKITFIYGDERQLEWIRLRREEAIQACTELARDGYSHQIPIHFSQEDSQAFAIWLKQFATDEA
jgi:hypothetical protein